MFHSGSRSAGSPIVFFQRYALSILSPSTQQPPGNRTNAGFSAASISHRSGRRPWSFQVFAGKSETMSRSTVPAAAARSARRACGSVALAFSSTWQAFHAAPGAGMDAFACTDEPSAVSSATSSGTGPRAYSDRRYVSPSRTAIPQYPPLATPAPAASAATRRKCGFFALTGWSAATARFAAPTALQCSGWPASSNERLRTSSA